MPEVDETQTDPDKTDKTSTGVVDELLKDLPDDPAERANELESRVVASVNRLQTENERLATLREEEKTRGDHWYDEWQKKESTSATPPDRREKRAEPAKPTLPPVDLAEFLNDEEHGYEKLATRIKDDFGLMTRDDFEAERANERTASQRSAAIQNQLSEDYPDLSDPRSALRKEAATQFLSLEKEHPGWDTEAIAELAVTRAARKVGAVAGKKPDAPDEGGDRARQTFGPSSRRTNGGKQAVVVDDKLKTMARRTAGEDLPPDALARVAADVSKKQEQASSRR